MNRILSKVPVKTEFGATPRLHVDDKVLLMDGDIKSSLSTTACSLLLTGTVTIDNTIPTKGGLTHLYTGTGVSNPLNLGVGFIDFTVASNGSGYWLDRTTNEFKNDAGTVQDLTTPIVLALDANKYVGKFEIKARETADSHVTMGSILGINSFISSNLSIAETSASDTLTSYNTNGITLGSSSAVISVNELNKTYVLHAEVYTHIKASLVNGNLQVVAWNPITQMGMAYRLGSDSVANADRPFKVDYQETKNLSGGAGIVYYGNKGRFLYLYATSDAASASLPSTVIWNDTSPTDNTFTFAGNSGSVNQSGGVYVDYFFANSEYKKLVNYSGTGAGTIFNTGFTASRVVIKSISVGGAGYNWMCEDNQRGDAFVRLDTSGIEEAWTQIDIGVDSITLVGDNNATSSNGVQYIAIVEADTNKNNGGIIFPFVTDDNNLLVTNGGYIHTDGKNLDGSFNKTSEVVSGTQSFDLAGVSDGKKYLAREFGTGALKVYDDVLTWNNGIDLWFNVEDGLHYVNTTPLTTPISFISRYPYMVISETPQYEMVNEKAIPVNVMDSLSVRDIRVLNSIILDIPTVNPLIAGAVWNNQGVLNISAG